MVEVNNLTNIRVDEKLLRGVAKKVLTRENKEKLELSIGLVGQKRIHDLNKKYRKKDRPTDVLSFQYDNYGEVVICLQEVKKNAKKYHSSFQRELTKVLSHGILHILGHHHDE